MASRRRAAQLRGGARGARAASIAPSRRRTLFYEKSQQLADESFAALSELDSVAKKLGLPLQTVDVFTRQGGGPFGNDRKIIDAVFSEVVLEERQNSPPVELGDDSVVVLRITDHKPSQQQSARRGAGRRSKTRLRTGGGAEGGGPRRPRPSRSASNAGESFAAAAAAAGAQPHWHHSR